jgi:hypothetical protein
VDRSLTRPQASRSASCHRVLVVPIPNVLVCTPRFKIKSVGFKDTSISGVKDHPPARIKPTGLTLMKTAANGMKMKKKKDAQNMAMVLMPALGLLRKLVVTVVEVLVLLILLPAAIARILPTGLIFIETAAHIMNIMKKLDAQSTAVVMMPSLGLLRKPVVTVAEVFLLELLHTCSSSIDTRSTCTQESGWMWL